MKTIVIENNGGGLQIEQYDDNNNIVSVVANLEFADDGSGSEDVKSYGQELDWSDVGGAVTGYGKDGNTNGDTHRETGKELTASDVIDDGPESNLVAEYDGEELTLYPDAMGRAAQDYFGVDND